MNENMKKWDVLFTLGGGDGDCYEAVVKYNEQITARYIASDIIKEVEDAINTGKKFIFFDGEYCGEKSCIVINPNLVRGVEVTPHDFNDCIEDDDDWLDLYSEVIDDCKRVD